MHSRVGIVPRSVIYSYINIFYSAVTSSISAELEAVKKTIKTAIIPSKLKYNLNPCLNEFYEKH